MTYRKVPFKDYVKFGIIVLVSLITCLLLFIIYNNFKDNSSVLTNKAKEIDIKDLDNYIEDNDTIFLYFGVVDDNNSKKIEEEMVNLIDEDDVDLIYVNISNEKNKKTFLKTFSNKYANEIYSSNKIVSNYPAFVYIKNGEIVDVIEKDDRNIEIEDVKEFIKANEIKGEKNA